MTGIRPRPAPPRICRTRLPRRVLRRDDGAGAQGSRRHARRTATEAHAQAAHSATWEGGGGPLTLTDTKLYLWQPGRQR